MITAGQGARALETTTVRGVGAGMACFGTSSCLRRSPRTSTHGREGGNEADGLGEGKADCVRGSLNQTICRTDDEQRAASSEQKEKGPGKIKQTHAKRSCMAC